MRVQVQDFPADSRCELGNLRTELVYALRRADRKEEVAKLLASTLGVAAAKLRKVYKEDDIKSKAQLKREAVEAKLKAEAEAKAEAEPTKKVTVSKPKPKAKS